MNHRYYQKRIRAAGFRALLGFWVLLIGGLPSSALAKDLAREGSETVQVQLTEWEIAMDQRVLKAGKLRFKAVNQGRIDHEMVVIQTGTPAHAFKVVAGKVVEDAVGKVMGEIEGFPPGQTKSLTLDLPEGTYVLFCNNLDQEDVQGHYQRGMRIAFEVMPSQ